MYDIRLANYRNYTQVILLDSKNFIPAFHWHSLALIGPK